MCFVAVCAQYGAIRGAAKRAYDDKSSEDHGDVEVELANMHAQLEYHRETREPRRGGGGEHDEGGHGGAGKKSLVEDGRGNYAWVTDSDSDDDL